MNVKVSCRAVAAADARSARPQGARIGELLMSWDDDQYYYEQEEAMQKFLDEELRRISEEPVFAYLAANGDAIERRVHTCLEEAKRLITLGFGGASLVRAAAGIEVTIRFFLARPLVQGAFLSDDWAQLLTQKVLNGRTAEDRDLLPSILRNWGIDITALRLTGGAQIWEQIINRVWPRRNDYVHKADGGSLEDARIAVESFEALLVQVVDPLARRLGFTREKTGCWCVVAVANPEEFPDLNPPRRHERADPFAKAHAA
jgi:hypothetical protein